jgi:hypothetical protein
VQIYEIIKPLIILTNLVIAKQELSKCLEAKSAIEKFQPNIPQWNPNIIK